MNLRPRKLGLAMLGTLALALPARGDMIDELAAPGPRPSLALNLSEAIAGFVQPPQPGGPPKTAEVKEHPKAYGKAGSRWWTFGTAYAHDSGADSDFNIHGAFSEFIADDLEFAIEAAGWYFHQRGDDTGGVSCSMVFRWHFAHAADYDWTFFADAGIGLLAGFDNVPDGGTGIDFLPRLGGGFTKALTPSVDGENRGPRLMVGARWHHISNGRLAGDSRNPSRDSLLGYVAITIPF